MGILYPSSTAAENSKKLGWFRSALQSHRDALYSRRRPWDPIRFFFSYSYNYASRFSPRRSLTLPCMNSLFHICTSPRFQFGFRFEFCFYSILFIAWSLASKIFFFRNKIALSRIFTLIINSAGLLRATPLMVEWRSQVIDIFCLLSS